ncbi:MAG TPA: DUF6538 domain-containing protein [Azospirillaceae bacterium]|nr:DUF6538 domain-containing protein [Azospirillaceae bacterium]
MPKLGTRRHMVQKRGGVWYFKRRVPLDLAEKIGKAFWEVRCPRFPDEVDPRNGT